MSKNKAKNLFVWFSLLPSLILFTIFMIIPTINVFWMSLLKWGGLSANKKFVGFNNFLILFKDMKFIRALQNTIFLIVFVTVFTIVIALIFASILVREQLKGQTLFRIIFYIPNILSIVVISAIFASIYDSNQNGLLNSIIGLFVGSNFKTIKFLGDPQLVVYSVAGALIWQAIGYYMVMYMASMSAISKHLYEAADLEGASKITQFFNITIPLIWTNIRTTLTFFVISTINLSFLLVKLLTGGGPDGASETVLTYLYHQAYNNASYGYGMAIGAIVFIGSFLLSLALSSATKRKVIQY